MTTNENNYAPEPSSGAVLRLEDDGSGTVITSKVIGACPPLVLFRSGTSIHDIPVLMRLVDWAREHHLPESFVAKIPDLGLRDEATTRRIADALAALGYAWTANDLRASWIAKEPLPPPRT